MNQITDNLKNTQSAIRDACIRNKQTVRDDKDIRLIAVSKKQSDNAIDMMLKAGQRIYGENRVQEAMEHWGERCMQYDDLELHLIGPLQTNKVADAVKLFDVIQTLDRPKLVKALSKEMKKQDKYLPCFIQVNTGAEEQKAGVEVEELAGLLTLCEEEGLSVQGLMCIPPINEPSALHFAFLKKLAEKHALEHLSMGMSSDFEQAIPLGATYVRVGTALFGARDVS